MPDNEITKHEPKPLRVGAQPVGLAAKRKAALEAQAKAEGAIAKPTVDTTPLFTDPSKMPDRIGIVFDDSGSMSSTIRDAHKGIEEFLRNCNPKTTAIAVYPMNEQTIKLSINLPQIAKDVTAIGATGGTPAVETLETMVGVENLTRSIVFSDGSFAMYNWPNLLPKLKTKEMAVDTVYIGHDNSYAIENLKKIADDTGGIFMHFKPGTTSFSKAFKYLSPGLRLQLMDSSFKEKVEKGQV